MSMFSGWLCCWETAAALAALDEKLADLEEVAGCLEKCLRTIEIANSAHPFTIVVRRLGAWALFFFITFVILVKDSFAVSPKYACRFDYRDIRRLNYSTLMFSSVLLFPLVFFAVLSFACLQGIEAQSGITTSIISFAISVYSIIISAVMGAINSQNIWLSR